MPSEQSEGRLATTKTDHRMNFKAVGWFILAFTSGGIVAASGPVCAVLLQGNNTLNLFGSHRARAKTIFIALVLFPCLMVVLMFLQRLRHKPFFSGTTTNAVVAASVAILGYEVWAILRLLL
jgi:hypothetical protein